jgi:ATP-dependent DNA helicase HFM1/MER3
VFAYVRLTSRAHRLDTSSSSFTISADFSEPKQRLMAFIGVNDLSGLMNTAEFDPDIPVNLFPTTPKGQDGDDGNASIAPGSARMENGKFPCSHKCADKQLCNHVCCKVGVKKISTHGKGNKGNPRPASEREFYDLATGWSEAGK